MLADRGLPLRCPVGAHELCCLWQIKQFEAEADKPFRVHVVDDVVGHLLRVFQRLRLPPVADAGHDGFHEVIMVDAHECFAPLLRKSALDLKKFVMRPSLERFFFRAAPKNDAFLVAELHGLPIRNHRPLQHLAQVEFSGQFVAKYFRMVRGCTGL